MKKRIIPAIILCIVMIITTGCDLAGIYDDNARLIKTADNISAKEQSRNRSGEEFTYSATMTGVTTIWRQDSIGETEVTLSYYLSVHEGGKAKLILIMPDDEVVTLAENIDNTVDDKLKEIKVTLKHGANRIRLVGYDNPKIEMKLIG
ncbi:MAG: hypothetical protein FWF94_08015 [Oscillospiraceae bacterium]|nr:hypothetical protein [Oscillospiraceae bacterium]